MYAYVSVGKGWGIYECNCPQRPEENVEAPGARVTGHCKLTDVGAGN